MAYWILQSMPFALYLTTTLSLLTKPPVGSTHEAVFLNLHGQNVDSRRGLRWGVGSVRHVFSYWLIAANKDWFYPTSRKVVRRPHSCSKIRALFNTKKKREAPFLLTDVLDIPKKV
jgi:hypothetical protein